MVHCANSCLDSKNEKNRREVISLFYARGRSEFCFGVVNLEFDLDVCVHLLDDSDDRGGDAVLGEYFSKHFAVDGIESFTMST